MLYLTVEVKRIYKLVWYILVYTILGIKQVDECQRKVSKLKAMGIPTKNLKLIEVDMKSLKSVSKFAESVLERAIRVDLLICNGKAFATC